MGLLDIFQPPAGSPFGGLLGGQQGTSPYTADMRRMAAMQALGQMGGGLLAAGAPSPDPGHFGRTLGQSFGQAGQAYQSFLDQQFAMSEWQKQQERERAAEDWWSQNAPPGLEGLPYPGAESVFDYATRAQGGGDPTTASQVSTFVDAEGNTQFGTYDQALANGWRLAPEQPDLTSAQREYQTALAEGFQGSFLDFKTALAEASSTRVEVNTGDVALGRGEEAAFGFNEASVGAAIEAAEAVSQMLPMLDQAEQALARIPEGSFLEPGGAPETRMALARIAEFVGADIDEELSAAEQLNAINNKMAPLMRATGSGSQSDMEFDAFRRAAPGMMTTRAGNTGIISMYREMAAFASTMASIKKQALINTGNSPGEFDAEVKRLTAEAFGTDNPSIGPSFSALATEGAPSGESGGAAGDGPPLAAGAVPQAFMDDGFTVEQWAKMPENIRAQYQAIGN